MDYCYCLVSSFPPLPTTFFLFLFIFQGISGTTFTIVNKCDYTVWPGILGNAQLGSTGFELSTGSAQSFQASPGWSGRFWGRTGCAPDPTTGRFTCATGDCGSAQLECNGNGATPPATLAQFTVGSSTQDFYDVSLVDGFNLPMIVEPSSGSGSCLSTGCVADFNRHCPTELRVGSGQACRSACEAFGKPEYCCSGASGSPETCRPSVYSDMFKAACPRSYSYAYDDATSTFTCTGPGYTITFCPSSTGQKSESTSQPTTTTTNNSSSEQGESPPSSNSSLLLDFLTGKSEATNNIHHSSYFAFFATFLASSISVVYYL